MRAFGLAFGVLVVLVGLPAVAQEDRFERSLQMLAPDERLEQLCDYTAMVQIRKDAGNYRPDRAVANATAEPHLARDSIEAKGGAFRSHGKWYVVSYKCTTTPDHLTVTSFQYKIGPEIPEAKWAAYGLWQ